MSLIWFLFSRFSPPHTHKSNRWINSSTADRFSHESVQQIQYDGKLKHCEWKRALVPPLGSFSNTNIMFDYYYEAFISSIAPASMSFNKKKRTFRVWSGSFLLVIIHWWILKVSRAKFTFPRFYFSNLNQLPFWQQALCCPFKFAEAVWMGPTDTGASGLPRQTLTLQRTLNKRDLIAVQWKGKLPKAACDQCEC